MKKAQLERNVTKQRDKSQKMILKLVFYVFIEVKYRNYFFKQLLAKKISQFINNSKIESFNKWINFTKKSHNLQLIQEQENLHVECELKNEELTKNQNENQANEAKQNAQQQENLSNGLRHLDSLLRKFQSERSQQIFNILIKVRTKVQKLNYFAAILSQLLQSNIKRHALSAIIQYQYQKQTKTDLISKQNLQLEQENFIQQVNEAKRGLEESGQQLNAYKEQLEQDTQFAKRKIKHIHSKQLQKYNEMRNLNKLFVLFNFWKQDYYSQKTRLNRLVQIIKNTTCQDTLDHLQMIFQSQDQSERLKWIIGKAIQKLYQTTINSSFQKWICATEFSRSQQIQFLTLEKQGKGQITEENIEKIKQVYSKRVEEKRQGQTLKDAFGEWKWYYQTKKYTRQQKELLRKKIQKSAIQRFLQNLEKVINLKQGFLSYRRKLVQTLIAFQKSKFIRNLQYNLEQTKSFQNKLQKIYFHFQRKNLIYTFNQLQITANFQWQEHDFKAQANESDNQMAAEKQRILSQLKESNKKQKNERFIFEKVNFLYNLLNSQIKKSQRKYLQKWAAKNKILGMITEDNSQGQSFIEIQFLKNKAKIISDYLQELGVNQEEVEKYQKEKKQQKMQLLEKYLKRITLNQQNASEIVESFQIWKENVYNIKKMRKLAITYQNRVYNNDLFYAFRHWKLNSIKSASYFFEMQRKDLSKLSIDTQIKIEQLQDLASKQQIKLQQENIDREVLLNKQFGSKVFVFLYLHKLVVNQKKDMFENLKEYCNYQKQCEHQYLESQSQKKINVLSTQFNELEQSLQKENQANKQLIDASMEFVNIAESIQKVASERDKFQKSLSEKAQTIRQLMDENNMLQMRLNLMQKEAQQLQKQNKARQLANM